MNERSDIHAVLGIETSCDETSVAVLENGKVRSNVISSQLIHREYGGVVPELASRAHIELVVQVMNAALESADRKLDDIEGIAAVFGPGLVGALLVGVNFGKSLAWSRGLPFTGVGHMEGHVYSVFLDDRKPLYPFVCLTVSGGHTELLYIPEPLRYELLGRTRDDAAGEAFDKVAKMLGIGYPGGPIIDKMARSGDPNAIRFPRSYAKTDHFDFSFSGLKTSVLYYLQERNKRKADASYDAEYAETADICASFQQAVVDVLIEKTVKAVEKTGVREVAVVGGVSANSRLREEFFKTAEQRSLTLHFPRQEYCTDNAAMSAYAGWLRLCRGERSELTLTAVPNLQIA